MTDVMVRDARVVELEEGSRTSIPVDVLVEAGTVAQVGRALRRPAGVDEIDADGRWMIPGLWDQHVHFGQWTAKAHQADFSATTSPEDVTRLVGELVIGGPGASIVGQGHRSGGWVRDPTVRELDDVSGDVPVVLISGDVHHGWLNSAALRRLGVPPRESVLREDDWFAVYPRVASLFGAQTATPQAYRESLNAAAARGVVGLADFELEDGTAAWSSRWNNGCDVLRVRPATYPDGLDAVIARGLRTDDVLTDCDDRATVGPLKIISDGSLNTRTAWCCAPYAGPAGSKTRWGAPNLSTAELLDLVGRAHAAGLQIATHAIGDAAVRAAVEAYARTGARGSIEHVQLAQVNDVMRMAEIGLRASVQPAHLLDDRELIDQLWPGRADRCFAFRTLLDHGVEVTLGSDAPVSPLDPWLSIDAAVHRGESGEAAWHPEQAMTRREALAASVDGQPSVQPGSRGDIVLLDRDPLDDSVDLRTMPVAATWVAGTMVWSRL